MAALAFYISLIALAVAVSTATLCLVSFAKFRHHSALWLSVCMIGITAFSVTGLVFQLASLVGDRAVGPVGVRLLFQGIGGVLITYGLPRFLLSAYGVKVHPVFRRLLDALTLTIVALSAVRVATGWDGLQFVASVPNNLLRVVLYALIFVSLALTLSFQSQLPDRSLYKTILFQVGTVGLLFPFVVLEDLGLFRLREFPYLTGQILLVTMSLSAAWHAQKSLMRPKYVSNQAPSQYFSQHFGISDREFEIVSAVLQGHSTKEIGEQLFISPRTVEKHLSNIYQKVGIKSRLQLYNLMRSDAL